MYVLLFSLVFSNSGCVSTAPTPDPFAAGTLVRGANLEIKLDWLQINVIPNSKYKLNNTYIIEINSNESVLPRKFEFNGLDDVIIVLRSKKTNRTISLSADGAMFEILSGVTLVLDGNITLVGRPENLAPLVYVKNGTLILEPGSSITGNTNNSFGGGVHITDNGTFIMNGGTVSGNTALGGGGVFVSDGTFTKTGGVITGSDSEDGNAASQSDGGSAVYARDTSGAAKRKEITSGLDDNLFFSSSANMFTGSWDD